MIYVSHEHLNQVEYLIGQSLQGNHVLFDLDRIRIAFEQCKELSEEDSYEVEHHIEHLITQETISEKKAYLQKLDDQTCNIVIRTYFNIIENNLYESKPVQH